MYLARVLGSVVTPVQHPFFEGRTLLLVRRVDPVGSPGVPGPARDLDATKPSTVDRVAVDRVGAGAGDLVLVLEEGNSARQIVDDARAPLRSVVVGFVDEVEIDGKIALSNDGREEDAR